MGMAIRASESFVYDVATSGSPTTHSFEILEGDDLLVICVAATAKKNNAVTYDGEAMTEVAVSEETTHQAYVWALDSPNPGENDISLTWATATNNKRAVITAYAITGGNATAIDTASAVAGMASPTTDARLTVTATEQGQIAFYSCACEYDTPYRTELGSFDGQRDGLSDSNTVDNGAYQCRITGHKVFTSHGDGKIGAQITMTSGSPTSDTYRAAAAIFTQDAFTVNPTLRKLKPGYGLRDADARVPSVPGECD